MGEQLKSNRAFSKILVGASFLVFCVSSFILGYYTSTGSQSRTPSSADPPTYMNTLYEHFVSDQNFVYPMPVTREDFFQLQFKLSQSVKPDLFCLAYPRILMSFKAEGMAVNGEIPNIQIETLCTVNEKTDTIIGVDLFPEEFSRKTPVDQKFDVSTENLALKIQVFHISDHWPTTWILEHLNFQHKDGTNDDILLTQNDFKNQSIIWNW